MDRLPSGTVTFLFTDIEGSTKLWEQHPEAMKSALAKHDSILKDAIESNRGHIIKTTGDGVHAVFATALDGINAAINAQRELNQISEVLIRARMGLDTGEAELRDGDYYGGTLNRAARIMSAGHGGQMLISDVTAQVAREHLADDISLQDMGECHLKGLLKPEHIYQVNVPGLEHNFPPLQSLPAKTSNLPQQLTSFIGRERELSEANDRLPNARLLTLVGPGGTGKTRLSLRVAEEQLPHFKDGVWFVELASISDPANIIPAISAVFELREVQGVPLLTFVLDYLRAKHLLLILDNCEHLVEASAQIADQILHTSPQVKIIASSREALGINGESVYRVPSLPDNDATRLFIERATKADSRFQVTEHNAPAIAQICHRLDGIPLAIELAAARVKVFSAEQIAQRLDDRFKLLTGGSRTALPRQQTLRALIDWSYTSLNELEQRTLRQLAVFMGGWTFDGAEAVVGESEALDGLVSLVNKSLVNVEEQESESRYRFLETIRQYAMEKLLESGEGVEARNRHLDYFMKLAEDAEQYLYGANSLGWVMRLESEYDNMRAAIEWGLDNSLAAVLRMAGALPNFWFRRGYEGEGLQWIQRALDRCEELPESLGENERMKIIAKAWQAVSFMAFSRGNMPEASAAAAKCATIARALGDKRLLGTVLSFEASANMMSGRIREAEPILDEALKNADESNDALAIGMAYGMGGTRRMMAGMNDERAKAMLAKGLGMLKGNENRFGYVMISFGAAMSARFNGRFAEARTQFTPLISTFRDMGDHHRSNMICSELAHMDRLEGNLERALPQYRETIIEWKRLGHRAAVANQIECFAFIAKAQEQPERATILLGAAETLRELINIDMSPMERIEYNREVEDLKANMNEKDFSSAWSKGRSMTMEQAIDLSLGSL
ncbi:MAG TPA: adenylate/guanylate cyclase domain-containing protein [Anaerolineales bacterium]|nr:adenylate/guanylate cyclase domain-containing protein [Anaerolineales bacterium]